MALRCLLFSSNEEMIQPIWQVLADLGIEGEYCKSAVDAVEKVTTQLFQIVITDWEDQPEAAFLLKTARDLKAAQRPLTLAIVSDDARLPEALQAGANSVLMKPIRAEQVRDTMTTACELLRSKLQPGAPTANEAPGPAAMVAAAASSSSAASAGTAASIAPSTAAASAPVFLTQAPENTFRAGEFLQSQNSAPGTHFETECEVQKSLDQAAAAEVDALEELEPVASAVADAVADAPAEAAETQEPLSGWAALQERLTKSAPPAAEEAPPKNELLAYGEPHAEAQGNRALAGAHGERRDLPEKEPETAAEAALFAYMSEKPKEAPEPAPETRPKLSKALVAGALALASVVLVAVPQTRQRLGMLYREGVHAGGRWLNPPPVPVAQAPPQHESFGQAGDEYKLPVAGNIPDATTDPTQIRVLPVIDPTAKAAKNSDANSGQSQAAADDTKPTDQNPTEPNASDANQSGQVQGGQAQTAEGQNGEGQVSVQAAPSATDTPGSATGALLAPGSGEVQAAPNPPVVQMAAPPRTTTPLPPLHITTPPPPHTVPTGSSTAIPSSLKSHTALMTPEASGAMPVEAAMSSIEPVKLPESIVLGLLAQPVDPVYPEAAKAGGQHGSVVLQVLIGRDGAVQDAMFLQGSLVFARAAIDAVKQWRFKPYSLNGRAVAVQGLITLTFKPPA